MDGKKPKKVPGRGTTKKTPKPAPTHEVCYVCGKLRPFTNWYCPHCKAPSGM